jgi:hypothetical protein
MRYSSGQSISRGRRLAREMRPLTFRSQEFLQWARRDRTCDLGIKSPARTAATRCNKLKLPAERNDLGREKLQQIAACGDKPVLSFVLALAALSGNSRLIERLADMNSRPLLTMELLRQPVATYGNGFRLFEPFRRRRICERLPTVATTGLHKCIPLRAELVQQLRRALHVGEEKRDCPGGKLAPHWTT